MDAAVGAGAAGLNGARPAGPRGEVVAVLLWVVLLSGVVITSGLCVLLHPGIEPLRHPVNATILAAGAIAFAGVGASAVLPLLRRIEQRGREENVRWWWRRILPRALAVWAVGDVVGMIGAVAYLKTRGAAVLLATGVRLAVPVLRSPGRLERK